MKRSLSLSTLQNVPAKAVMPGPKLPGKRGDATYVAAAQQHHVRFAVDYARARA